MIFKTPCARRQTARPKTRLRAHTNSREIPRWARDARPFVQAAPKFRRMNLKALLSRDWQMTSRLAAPDLRRTVVGLSRRALLDLVRRRFPRLFRKALFDYRVTVALRHSRCHDESTPPRGRGVGVGAGGGHLQFFTTPRSAPQPADRPACRGQVWPRPKRTFQVRCQLARFSEPVTSPADIYMA